MKLKEMCTAAVVSCGAKTTASEAARLMRDQHVGDVVVVDDPREEGTPLGIVTDRDLVIEVLGELTQDMRSAHAGRPARSAGTPDNAREATPGCDA